MPWAHSFVDRAHHIIPSQRLREPCWGQPPCSLDLQRSTGRPGVTTTREGGSTRVLRLSSASLVLRNIERKDHGSKRDRSFERSRSSAISPHELPCSFAVSAGSAPGLRNPRAIRNWSLHMQTPKDISPLAAGNILFIASRLQTYMRPADFPRSWSCARPTRSPGE